MDVMKEFLENSYPKMDSFDGYSGIVESLRPYRWYIISTLGFVLGEGLFLIFHTSNLHTPPGL